MSPVQKEHETSPPMLNSNAMLPELHGMNHLNWLLLRSKPATLTEFVDLCDDMNTTRRQIQKESPRPGPSNAAPQSTAPPPQVTTATGSSPGPMGLFTNRRRITAEEKARRMAEGRCYRCGEIEHMVRDCPLGQRTLQDAAIAPTITSSAAVITPNAEPSEN